MQKQLDNLSRMFQIATVLCTESWNVLWCNSNYDIKKSTDQLPFHYDLKKFTDLLLYSFDLTVQITRPETHSRKLYKSRTEINPAVFLSFERKIIRRPRIVLRRRANVTLLRKCQERWRFKAYPVVVDSSFFVVRHAARTRQGIGHVLTRAVRIFQPVHHYNCFWYSHDEREQR